MRRKAVFLGELMLSLAPRHNERFVQASEASIRYTGAEANTAVALQQFGVDTFLVSVVPAHEIGDACVNTFRAFGVDTSAILRRGERLGLLYLETGAAQRSSKVIYDRAHSAFAGLQPGDMAWPEILAWKDWFHVSGTAPALTSNTAEAVIEACAQARQMGLRISIDLNFRHQLWHWDPARLPGELAAATIRRILPFVDVVFANEGQARDVLGHALPCGSDREPRLVLEAQAELARRIAAESPSIRHVTMTMRENIDASHNRWGALLYDVEQDRSVVAPMREGRYCPYEIVPVVDRVGAGDSFAAGLIHGLLHERPLQETLAFAVAASCLKHSIPGDLTFASLAEVEQLMEGTAIGYINR